MIVAVEFSSPANAAEWLHVDPRIAGIVFALAGRCAREGLPSLMVTSVARSPEEQARLYAGRSDAPASSPHIPDWRGVVRAVDLSVRALTAEQVEVLTRWINSNWPRTDGFRTCLAHNVAGYHWHIQVPRVPGPPGKHEAP